ncbi:MAG: N-acetylmuramoyl-L-alanine amidase family protein [Anaerotruncus massiliensis (ex Togo et al. 2019)]
MCLDPGHGGADPGAVLKSRYEKDDVLRLACALKPLLEAQGLGVVLTRDSDAALPIAERCRIANEAGCAYFLSLHRDAADPSARGVGLWVHSGADWPTVQKAQDILTELLAVTPVRDRGVRKGTPQNYRDFGVNTGTVMASRCSSWASSPTRRTTPCSTAISRSTPRRPRGALPGGGDRLPRPRGRGRAAGPGAGDGPGRARRIGRGARKRAPQTGGVRWTAPRISRANRCARWNRRSTGSSGNTTGGSGTAR